MTVGSLRMIPSPRASRRGVFAVPRSIGEVAVASRRITLELLVRVVIGRGTRGRRSRGDCSARVGPAQPSQCSRFQIGAVSFSVSMQNRAASNASARCGDDTTTTTDGVGQRESPARCSNAIRSSVGPAPPAPRARSRRTAPAPRLRTPRTSVPCTPSRPSEWSRTTPRKRHDRAAARRRRPAHRGVDGKRKRRQRQPSRRPSGGTQHASHRSDCLDDADEPSTDRGRRVPRPARGTRPYTPRHGQAMSRRTSARRPAARSARSRLGSPVRIDGVRRHAPPRGRAAPRDSGRRSRSAPGSVAAAWPLVRRGRDPRRASRLDAVPSAATDATPAAAVARGGRAQRRARSVAARPTGTRRVSGVCVGNGQVLTSAHALDGATTSRSSTPSGAHA